MPLTACNLSLLSFPLFSYFDFVKISKKSLLVILYLRSNSIVNNLILRTYDFDLTTITDVGIGKTENYPGGTGSFFKVLGLGEIYAAIIFYPNYNEQKLKRLYL